MKKNVIPLMIIALSFFVANLISEHKKNIPNDSKTTYIEGTNLNAVYSGMPKRLAWDEFNGLAKKKSDYCPACTLKDGGACKQYPCQSYNLIPDPIYKDIQAIGDDWMQLANAKALQSVLNGGGPFGAVIIQVDDESGKVIRYWINNNHVVEWNDPTAHAEMTTIRVAARDLEVTNLGRIHKDQSKLPQSGEWSHCVIYSSAEPCPMCIAAIYWAGISKLAFAATRYDAAVQGVNFSDKMIYEELDLPYIKRNYMYVVHANIDNSLDAFNYYKRNQIKRYGEELSLLRDLLKNHRDEVVTKSVESCSNYPHSKL